jgi:hypothetical protein
MRLLYYFFSGGSPHLLGDHMRSEGFFALWDALTSQGVLDEVIIILDEQEPQAITYTPKVRAAVVRGVEETLPWLRDDDLIFIRGMFKQWTPFVEEVRRRGNWLLFYGGNSGRDKWPYWHIVLNDLLTESYGNEGKVFLPFVKPTNPAIFHCTHQPLTYDVCLGASNIHDKKGQWMGVNALIAGGNRWKAALPGSPRRGLHTPALFDWITENNLTVDILGGIPREQVARLFNRTALLLHLSGHGQNDRSVLEALACGTHVVISHPERHTPLLMQSPGVSVWSNPEDATALAAWLETNLPLVEATPGHRTAIASNFTRTMGLHEVVVPWFTTLIEWLNGNPPTEREALLHGNALRIP